MEETPEQEKDTRLKRVARIILITFALLFCVLAIAVFVGPDLQSAWQWYWGPPESRGDLSATERKDLAQGAGPYAQALAVLFTGMVALIGLYFTRRNTDRQLAEARENTEKQLRQARESQERTQASAQENLRLTEQGQLTERFTRAIEQLGNDKLEIRLGGIYALERIAEDSERDHWPIVEVLTAYVREHSPWPPNRRGTRGGGNTFISSPALHQRPAPEERRQAKTDEDPPPLEPDVQVVLTVLGRRSRYYGNGEMKSLDLSRTDLRRAVLRGAHLEMSALIGAHLERAFLERAHLKSALLHEAHLERAVLTLARLERATLDKAHLDGAFLIGAHLEGAKLVRAHLERASLIEAHLEGADLSRATGLTQEQIEAAYGDRKTVLPEGLKYPAHWDQGSNDQPNGDE